MAGLALSRELGINPKTVAKWRKRATVGDLKTNLDFGEWPSVFGPSRDNASQCTAGQCMPR
ncbi:hypothetical protein SSE37_05912 [Sagittula stellata E-37]|uniref:Transposase n=1 Tax=Sagittula stellata (strain ATCC 700073 / DSM 11524 / E-37) TaxID=388399 RepID=A3K9M3_SAGS3|nr:hypothetical protein SSE37_05912 [Sagittula stellata E-37]